MGIGAENLGLPDRQTDKQADTGQSDAYVTLYSQATQKWIQWNIFPLLSLQIQSYPQTAVWLLNEKYIEEKFVE